MDEHDYEAFLEEAFTRAFKHRMGSSGASASPMGNLNQPAVPATPPPPTPPPLMRASTRLHFSKFNTNFLPAEMIAGMTRNQVVAPSGRTIPNNMLDWCEGNCSKLWMPSPPAAPEYIMFECAEDMTLFLNAFGGG